MPIDFCFAVRSFLKATKPEKLLIMETELWPNTLHTVAKFGIPISVLNARLSEKSYLGYKKVQPLFNLLGRHLTHVCCQYQDDADRFIALGIDKYRVHVTGSVKFDLEITNEIVESGKQIRHQLGSERPIWIAASTHKGEDEQILASHKVLLASIPNALLILVPRHPERFNSVFTLCQKSNFSCIKRTSNQTISSKTQVYLGDTMGEMLTLISAADICFMGGSLLGDKVGGHNLLEPAALKKPSITGPSYYNFLEITETLIKEDATKVITSSKELATLLEELITQPEYAKRMGKNAQGFISANSGAVEKTLTLI